MNKKTKHGLITASIVIAATYLLYKIFNKKAAINPNNGGNSANGGGAVVKDPNIGGTIGAAPTMSEAKFKEIADEIYSAFWGYGTNNKTIKNQFALLRNNDDVMSLIAAYKIRLISSGDYNPAPDFTGNLPEALADELDEDEISELNSILVKNGITIRFNSDGKLSTI
jgi:hypothetical protein